MDSFDIDNVKLEKANAMKRYNRLQKIGNFFRIFEVCVALILFSWFSTRLPTAVQISEKYFRDLCVIVVSPRFVFFLGNAIILTLFVKSGKFSGDESAPNNDGNHLYDEFVKKSETKQRNCTDISPPPPYVAAQEEIVYQDKQTVYEENTVPAHTYKPTVTDHSSTNTSRTTTEEPKIYRRSQSDISKPQVNGKPRRELRRSETEKCRKFDTPAGEETAEMSYSEKVMSNEEFRRTIEEFIAKQVKFHREESMAIVLQ
ncbi:hypothetical protein BVC80_551g57 [Macleaya cordata]|uniref:DUF4408 domain-containing protein n=1 Tax=Macleaya cordata TaxID=56857 RepID=A0A200QE62_MACCD|nr:hypothetical protein BVC80_551g57 [Macleaya cordata]